MHTLSQSTNCRPVIGIYSNLVHKLHIVQEILQIDCVYNTRAKISEFDFFLPRSLDGRVCHISEHHVIGY
jgi:hypothetical protein